MMKSRCPKSVFRAYDIRGLFGDELTAPFAFNLARALATKWSSAGLPLAVGVGFDARTSSPTLAHALMEGFRTQKWDAASLGLVPSPVVYFSTFDESRPYGVVVTGSHNPAEYNGFKICVKGQSPSAEAIQDLYRWMSAHWVDYKHSNFSFPLLTTSRTYMQHLLADYQQHTHSRKKPLKIVIDSGSGAAGPVSTQVFQSTGHTVLPLFDMPDGRFPFHHPDPSQEKNLVHLKEKVLETKADIGLAFDGDGDRLGIVLPNGRTMDGDLVVLLFACSILENHPNATIITEVKARDAFFDMVSQRGGRALMSPTGHSIIKRRMKDENAILAGELSGHIFFADRYFGFDDAIYAALRFTLWIENPENSIDDFIKKIPDTFCTPEIRLPCSDEKKFEVVENLKSYFSKSHSLTSIDGVRIQFPATGWGLVRASNTQPELVLRFEGINQKLADSIQSTVMEALNQFLPSN